jgi:hypothetical protein
MHNRARQPRRLGLPRPTRPDTLSVSKRPRALDLMHRRLIDSAPAQASPTIFDDSNSAPRPGHFEGRSIK